MNGWVKHLGEKKKKNLVFIEYLFECPEKENKFCYFSKMSKFQKERGGKIIIGQTSKNNKKEKDKSK